MQMDNGRKAAWVALLFLVKLVYKGKEYPREMSLESLDPANAWFDTTVLMPSIVHDLNLRELWNLSGSTGILRAFYEYSTNIYEY